MWVHGWWTEGQRWPAAPMAARQWARERGYGQFTQAATTNDGLTFQAHPAITRTSYLRVFALDGWWYGVSRLGLLSRSRDPLGSFELGPNPGSFITLGAGNSQITGWLVSAGNIDYIGTLWLHADGSRSLDMNGSTAGAVSQTFDTNAGAQYEVRFAMAGNPAGQPTIKPLRVSAATATVSLEQTA